MKTALIAALLLLAFLPAAFAQQEEPPLPRVKPVPLPWKSARSVQKPSQKFKDMTNFFKSGLNVKDIFRMVPPAQLPFVGIRLEALKKDITEYGGQKGACGALIAQVVQGGSAEKGGLKKGDVITGLGGAPLSCGNEKAVTVLRTAFGKLAPGQSVKFSILRGGKPADISFTIGARETTLVQMPEHPAMTFDDAQVLSLLEKNLREKNIFDPFLETISQLAGTAYLAMNKTTVAGMKIPNPFRLSEVTYCLRNPLNTILVSQQVSDRIETCFNRANQNIPGLLRQCAALLDLDVPEPQNYRYNTFMPASLLDGFTAAASSLDAAFEQIGPEGRARLHKLAAEFIAEDLGDADEKEKAAAHKKQEEMLALAAQVDYAKVAEAALCIADRLTPYNLGCMAARLEDHPTVGLHPGVSGKVHFYKKTDFGLVVVGGSGRNVYHRGAAVIIDLGGDDLYLDGAAVATPENPFAILIDYSGNDTYLGKTAGPCSAGCGIAMLLDFAGKDIYGGQDMCQAWACAGVALLADFGGDDLYRAESCCQGAALFGIGLLLDTQPGRGGQSKDKNSEGNDSYIANCLAQGLGYPGGFGALVDTAGNDTYRACGKIPDSRDPDRSSLSLAQGFGYGFRPWEGAPGADGGIGVLADLEGHDFYVGDYFSQGASYWFALGILYDAKGDDAYLAGRYSQGAGIHLSLGSLLDWEGNDRYDAYYGVSQGLGHDWAVGFLFDGAGDDWYSSGALAQGAGNYVSLGILADRSGRDFYKAKDNAQGYGTELDSRGAGSLGLLLDCEGKDTYYPAKKNSATASGSHHGLLIDK